MRSLELTSSQASSPVLAVAYHWIRCGEARSVRPVLLRVSKQLISSHSLRAQPDLRPANGECVISVRRSHLFEDSYDQIMDQRPAKLKRRLNIYFKDEEGLDAGGLSRYVLSLSARDLADPFDRREFFFLLSKEIFRPDYGLFEFLAHDDYTLQVNPNSGIINDLGRSHLDLFKFCGRVVGMCVFHSHLLEAHFVPAFYKMVLERGITLADMESTDIEMFRSLSQLL